MIFLLGAVAAHHVLWMFFCYWLLATQFPGVFLKLGVDAILTTLAKRACSQSQYQKTKSKNHCVHFILQNHGTFAITQERTCVNKHMCVLPQQPVHHLRKFLTAQKSMRVAFTLCIGSPPKLPRKAVAKGEAMTFCKVRYETVCMQWVQLFYFISNPPVRFLNIHHNHDWQLISILKLLRFIFYFIILGGCLLVRHFLKMSKLAPKSPCTGRCQKACRAKWWTSHLQLDTGLVHNVDSQLSG